jgi:chemotaxis protein methyltransferase CheR
MEGTVAREFAFTRQDFDFLRRLASERTGIVVSDDKFSMFYSRLSRRLRALGLGDFKAYCELLRGPHGGDETVELINAITTNLTAFFRENHHFKFLAATVVPELLTRNAAERRVQVWSAGCSTGEEPYSIAMTLAESLPPQPAWDVQVHATDIDSQVLAKAASGIYPLERV